MATTTDTLRDELAQGIADAVAGAGVDAVLPVARRYADAQVTAALQQVADELSSYRWAGKAVAYIQGSTDRIAREQR